MTALDERRQRKLLQTFLHLEEGLSEVERLAEREGPFSSLSRHHGELDPETREAILQHVAHVRETMGRILEQKGIAVDVRTVHTAHAIHTHLSFMNLSAEELRPRYMRGYGELTEAAAEELEGIATELQALFRQMQGLLKT